MLISFIFSLFIACGSKTSDSAGDAVDLANGESIYTSTCLACHPANGDIEALAPDMSDADLENLIKNGEGGMPAQSSLSDADVQDVIAYIRATFG